ncbi:MAG: xanthine dehydrogenase accessory protein XdhC [Bdellovibrionales bacterium]
MNHFDWPLKISQMIEARKPFVVLTLASVKGSAPQVAGAKAIVTKAGLEEGTVGGGRIEAKAIAYAQELLLRKSASRCEMVQWNLIRDVGMTCGGIIHLVFEVYAAPAWEFVVFGAGHVAQELVPLLCRLDCQVTCVDDRAEWLERLPGLPNLSKTHHTNPLELVSTFSERVYFILMTRGHATDLAILAEILSSRSAPYVGVLGSASKSVTLRKDLRALGFSEEKLESFFCPVGFPVGNNSPVEIAISISAQLLEQRDIAAAAPLKLTLSP